MSTSQKRGSSAEVAADRRKQILKAAVEVFAERGFHRSRVSDIAKRAGVAYGLIYHYFQSKDHVLNSVFEENWAVFLKVLSELKDNQELTAVGRLKSVADLFIDALQIAPATIQVIIQEVSRSDRFVESNKLDAFEDGFSGVCSIISEGQKTGEIRSDLDPMVGAYIFFGALEMVCTGFMLKRIQCSTTEEGSALKLTVYQMLLAGMQAEPAKDPQ